MAAPDALPDVQIGDVWMDNDPRGGLERRMIRVLGFDGTKDSFDQKVKVENIETGKKSSIKRARFRSTSNGYSLHTRQEP